MSTNPCSPSSYKKFEILPSLGSEGKTGGSQDIQNLLKEKLGTNYEAFIEKNFSPKTPKNPRLENHAEIPGSPVKKIKQENRISKNIVDLSSPETKADAIAASLQETQARKTNDPDKMIAEILDLFPELHLELTDPQTSLKELLGCIFQLQSSNSFLQKEHWVKSETGKFFTIDILSEKEAYIEIKRTEEDKAKHGGESKFGRMIHVTDGKVGRVVGLKPRYFKGSIEQEINVRLDKVLQLKSIRLDPERVLSIPKAHIQYVKKNGLQQLVLIYEDLGDHILSSATKEKWDFQKTIEAMRLAAQSLGHIHEKEYLHRDIKPQNILGRTNSDGELTIKIADLSLLINKNDTTAPYAGTPDFISLKDYLAMKNSKSSEKPLCNSEASDRYAFGKTLLAMLERAEDFVPILDQGDLCIEKTQNKSCLESQKQMLLNIQNKAQLIKTITRFIGTLSMIKGNLPEKIMREISNELEIPFEQLNEETVTARLNESLNQLKSILIESDQSLAARRIDQSMKKNLFSSYDLTQINAILSELYRDSNIQFFAGQNVYLGLILKEQDPALKNSPQGKACQLIYDLMEEGRLGSTKEIEARLKEIQESSQTMETLERDASSLIQ
jgi:serine/threonine protein kinase